MGMVEALPLQFSNVGSAPHHLASVAEGDEQEESWQPQYSDATRIADDDESLPPIIDDDGTVLTHEMYGTYGAVADHTSRVGDASYSLGLISTLVFSLCMDAILSNYGQNEPLVLILCLSIAVFYST